MIAIIYERGGGSPDIVVSAQICTISTGKLVFPTRVSQYIYKYGFGGNSIGATVCVYGNDLILRSSFAYIGSNTREFVITVLDGNYNYDNFVITASRRIEIRNENGVLLADNGLPWGNGTYPPDAKNRTGSPLSVANPNLMDELKNGLTGDLVNIEGAEE